MVQAQSFRGQSKKEKEKDLGPVNYQNETNDIELRSLPHSQQGMSGAKGQKKKRGKLRRKCGYVSQ